MNLLRLPMSCRTALFHNAQPSNVRAAAGEDNKELTTFAQQDLFKHSLTSSREIHQYFPNKSISVLCSGSE